jgi:hypothetical protein
MGIDWHTVAGCLRDDAMKEFENADKQENREAATEFRIRGFILKSLANALFEGVEAT